MRTFEMVRPNSLFFDFDRNLETFFKPHREQKEGKNGSNYELHSDEKYYYLALEVPGYTKENLKIELKDNELTVSGERESFFDSEKKIDFEKAFIVPKDTLQDEIKVALKDGILKVTIPKDVSMLESKILEIQN